MAMDVVDYEIKGSEVEVELDPGEAAVGEAAGGGRGEGSVLGGILGGDNE